MITIKDNKIVFNMPDLFDIYWRHRELIQNILGWSVVIALVWGVCWAIVTGCQRSDRQERAEQARLAKIVRTVSTLDGTHSWASVGNVFRDNDNTTFTERYTGATIELTGPVIIECPKQ